MSKNIDDKLVKKAHRQVLYTAEQVEELKECLDPDTGPQYFMENFMYIQHPVKGQMLFSPYEYQEELIDVYHQYRYSIAMIGRQLGKTTVAAGYLLWYAMFNNDATILVAAHKMQGAQEIMQRVRYAYESLPDHIRAGVKEYNKQSIVFDNESRIIAQTTTDNTGRGLSLSLVYLDEFAFVEPRMAQELWTSLSPTLSTGGKCIITSTPNTDDDQFSYIWNSANKTFDEFGNEKETGENGFKGYKATWEAHPDRDEEWAEEERAKIGDERFEREHCCEFITFEETLINPIKLKALSGREPIAKTAQVRWYNKVNPDLTYVVTLDPSMGTGGDNAAIQVFELPTFRQVAEWQHNKSPIEDQVRILRQILTEIEDANEYAPEIYWTVESNSLGEAALVVIRDLGEEHFPGSFLTEPNREARGRGKRKGFVTTTKTKLQGCSKLKSLIENNKLEIASKSLASELKHFVARGKSYEARSGQTDDLVMATVVFVRMAMFIASWDDESHESMNTTGDNVFGDTDNDEYDDPMPMGMI